MQSDIHALATYPRFSLMDGATPIQRLDRLEKTVIG